MKRIEDIDPDVTPFINQNVKMKRGLKKLWASVKEKELIEHPNHYCWKGGPECKVLIKEMVKGLDGQEGYYIGNIQKYLYRFPVKNGLQDIDKALEYMKMLREYEVEKIKTADGNSEGQ